MLKKIKNYFKDRSNNISNENSNTSDCSFSLSDTINSIKKWLKDNEIENPYNDIDNKLLFFIDKWDLTNFDSWFYISQEKIDKNNWKFSLLTLMSKANQSIHLDEKNYHSEKYEKIDYLKFNATFKIKKPWYVEIKKSIYTLGKWNSLKDKEILFTIHHSIESKELEEIKEKNCKILNEKYKSVPSISIDSFTNKKEIKWSFIPANFYDVKIENISFDMSEEKKYFKLWPLFFIINNVENKDYIIFYFNKNLNLKIWDIISLLFDDNLIINFNIEKKPFNTIGNYSNEKEIRIQLTSNELENFKKNNLKKWQISYLDNPNKKSWDFYKAKFLTKFTNQYCELVKKEIVNYEPLTEKKKITEKMLEKEKCYVYLMLDTLNYYYKIWISNSPEYREKTLQSEKPEIEMICNKLFPNRDIALAFEQALHKTYSSKRVRWEWFNLNEDDIEDLKITLN